MVLLWDRGMVVMLLFGTVVVSLKSAVMLLLSGNVEEEKPLETKSLELLLVLLLHWEDCLLEEPVFAEYSCLNAAVIQE